MNFEGILNQIFQPYFYYSVISLVISFACIKGLLKFFNFMSLSQRTKSLLYFIPLLLPLVVMGIFVPSSLIQTTSNQLIAVPISTTGPTLVFPSSLFGVPPLQTSFILTSVPVTITTLSITGIISTIGLIAAAFLGVTIILADDRIARRILHVIPLGPQEHLWLQSTIAESAKKIGVGVPKIGLVEDLRPNAFTIGYGQRATIVFSLGLFHILSKEEMTAVAFHELAHVKNRDFFVKTLSSALAVISFFNPISYLASSAIQREREMLADEGAIKLLENPETLGNALAKICKVIQSLPKESVLSNFSSNLLVSSSVLRRIGIFSTHPRLDKRLRNISSQKSIFRLDRRRALSTFFLSVLLLSLAIVVSSAMVNIQVNYISSQSSATQSNSFIVTSYLRSSNSAANKAIMVPFIPQQSSSMSVIDYYATINEVTIQVINNASLIPQVIPEGGVIIVCPQSPAPISTQLPTVHHNLWIG